ncbi:MAG: hypothetical protein HY892_04950 [Deltaproteobacteria bacterium]|nr:hypothetical protein [Deltaproteobacteria bacterium]
MPFFPLVPLQEMALAFFLGLVVFILLYLAWGSYPRRPGETEGEEKRPESPEREGMPASAENPVPPFLIFVYTGVVLWVLAYWIVIGLRVWAVG